MQRYEAIKGYTEEQFSKRKYRNRRKRFGLRFNLIAGIYNFQLLI